MNDHKTRDLRTIPVSNIFLDEQNPRFPAVHNQREAISAMVNNQGKKLINLAKDICEHGPDPSKEMLVFWENGRLVDGDGNRRLTALKLLETPELTDNRIIRENITLLKKKHGAHIPSEANCVVLPSRKEARHWIEINHGGALDGRGQIPWDPEQNDRFKGNLSVGLQAIQLLQSKKLLQEGDKEKVSKTTFDRVLEFSHTKKLLGISKQGQNYLFENIVALKTLFCAMRGVKVEEVYRADKAITFINGVFPDGLPQHSNAPIVLQQQNGTQEHPETSRRTRRVKSTFQLQPFGAPLQLKPGDVNNLYRDIDHLFAFYRDNRSLLSDGFIAIFRMSLRLLAETAASDLNLELQDYLKNHFDAAKATLSKDLKTTLSTQAVEKNKIVQLFQTGGHSYSNGKNEEQALAMSVILGAILICTHGRFE